jgi:hypothetical protein
VAVEVNREGAVAREKKLVSRVALPDVPTDRVDDVGCQRERQRLVALAWTEKRRALLRSSLNRPVDDEQGRDVADAAAVSSHRRNGLDGAIGKSRIEEADQWGVEKRSKGSI